MTFYYSGLVPIAPKNLVGIAIKATCQERKLMHVGFLYQRAAGDIYFAHLADHNELENENVANIKSYYWANPDWLDDPDISSSADFIANFIEMSTRTKEIPYGPNPPDAAFDEMGCYISNNCREGLTCATYVSQVLAASGFPVVELATWPSRSDDYLWWSWTENYLKSVHPKRAEELDGIKIGFRLRPDEIATAVASCEVPLCFNDTVTQGASLRKLLFPSSKTHGREGEMTTD